MPKPRLLRILPTLLFCFSLLMVNWFTPSVASAATGYQTVSPSSITGGRYNNCQNIGQTYNGTSYWGCTLTWTDVSPVSMLSFVATNVTAGYSASFTYTVYDGAGNVIRSFPTDSVNGSKTVWVDLRPYGTGTWNVGKVVINWNSASRSFLNIASPYAYQQAADTVAPAAPTLSATFQPNLAATAPDNMSVTITPADADQIDYATYDIEVSTDGGATYTPMASGLPAVPGTATTAPVANPPSGAQTWRARFRDTSGNPGAWGTVSLTRPDVTVDPVTGVYDQTVSLKARMAAGAAPLSGLPVQFYVSGSLAGSATTDATGTATLSYKLTQGAGSYAIVARYAGNTTYSASAGRGQLTSQSGWTRVAPPSVSGGQNGSCDNLNQTYNKCTITWNSASPVSLLAFDAQGNDTGYSVQLGYAVYDSAGVLIKNASTTTAWTVSTKKTLYVDLRPYQSGPFSMGRLEIYWRSGVSVNGTPNMADLSNFIAYQGVTADQLAPAAPQVTATYIAALTAATTAGLKLDVTPGEGDVFDYQTVEIDRSMDNGTTWSNVHTGSPAVPGSVTSITLDNPPAGPQTYRVRFSDIHGNSGPYGQVSLIRPDLTLQDVTSAAFDLNATLKATLTSQGSPLAGKSVTFYVNGGAAVATATTDSNGVATGSYKVTLDGGSYVLAAKYNGDTTYSPTSAKAVFTNESGWVRESPKSANATSGSCSSMSSGSCTATFDNPSPVTLISFVAAPGQNGSYVNFSYQVYDSAGNRITGTPLNAVSQVSSERTIWIDLRKVGTGQFAIGKVTVTNEGGTTPLALSGFTAWRQISNWRAPAAPAQVTAAFLPALTSTATDRMQIQITPGETDVYDYMRVEVDLSTDNGATWSNVISTPPASPGSTFTGYASDPPTGAQTYRARFVDASGNGGAYAYVSVIRPELVVENASGSYSLVSQLKATLASQGQPLAGRTVTFHVDGNQVASAVTDANGVAATTFTVAFDGGVHDLAAKFAGDSTYTATGDLAQFDNRSGWVREHSTALSGGYNGSCKNVGSAYGSQYATCTVTFNDPSPVTLISFDAKPRESGYHVNLTYQVYDPAGKLIASSPPNTITHQISSERTLWIDLRNVGSGLWTVGKVVIRYESGSWYGQNMVSADLWNFMAYRQISDSRAPVAPSQVTATFVPTLKSTVTEQMQIRVTPGETDVYDYMRVEVDRSTDDGSTWSNVIATTPSVPDSVFVGNTPNPPTGPQTYRTRFQDVSGNWGPYSYISVIRPELVVENASGSWGRVSELKATLTSQGQPLPGRAITFHVDGAQVVSAVTDANGVAAPTFEVQFDGGLHDLAARFAGDATYTATGDLAQFDNQSGWVREYPKSLAGGYNGSCKNVGSAYGSQYASCTVTFNNPSPVTLVAFDAEPLVSGNYVDLSYQVYDPAGNLIASSPPNTVSYQISSARTLWIDLRKAGAGLWTVGKVQIRYEGGSWYGQNMMSANLSNFTAYRQIPDPLKPAKPSLSSTYYSNGTGFSLRITPDEKDQMDYWRYEVERSVDGATWEPFKDGIPDVPYADTVVSVTDAAGTAYFYRARLQDVSGNWSDWSDSLQIIVGTKITVTTLSATYGQGVTLEAILSYNGKLQANKSLQFSVEGVPVGSATTDPNGVARLGYTVGVLPGARTITVTYAGDTSVPPGTGTGTLNVEKAATVLSVADASGPYKGSAVLKATLTALGRAAADRTVRFTVNGMPAGQAVTNADGVATLSFPISRDPGTYGFTADFDGDEAYLASTGEGTLTVTKASASLAAGDVTGVVNSPAGLSATLTANYGPLPAGATLRFQINNGTVLTATTDATGLAGVPYTITLAPGSYPVDITFDGDGLHLGATFRATLTVEAAPSTLGAADVTAAYGDTAVLVATLTADGVPLPGRTLEFAVDGLPAGTAITDATGKAAVTFPVTLPPGDHAITVRFSGDTTYRSSDANALLHVTPAATSLTLVNAEGVYGGSTSLVATLTAFGQPVSGQTVLFTVDGQPAGSATTGSDGVARLPFALTLTPSQYPMQARFTGTESYLPSDASASLTVRPAATSVTVANVTGHSGAAIELKAELKSGATPLAGRVISFTVNGAGMAGTATTDANGVATLPYTINLPPGPYTIDAVFAGDLTYDPSAAAATLTVTKTPVVVVTVNRTGGYGSQVTLEATLRALGAPLAGKPITFLVDGQPAGTATTDAAGIATLPYRIDQTPGVHALQASFAEDAGYLAGSATATLTVEQSPSRLSLSDVTGAAGTTVDLRATLTDGAAPLAGRSVAFRVNGQSTGTAVTDANGVASLPYAINLAPGSYVVEGQFAGDTWYEASSGTAALTVSPAQPVLTVAPATGTYGGSGVLQATLSSTWGTLSGRTITFSVNGSVAGTAVSDASGTASLPFDLSLAPDRYPIDAFFAGDTQYLAASGTNTLTIVKAPVTLTVANVSGQSGETVLLQSALTGNGAPLAGRTLRIAVDGTPVGTAVTDASGVANLSVPLTGMTGGDHQVTVTFDGDNLFLPGAATGTLTVRLASVQFTAQDATAPYGASFSLQATLMGGGSPLAGRTVTFSAGDADCGSAVTNAAGTATVTCSAVLTPGQHEVVATFGGDGQFQAATARATLTVTQPATTLAVESVRGAAGTAVTLRATLQAGPAPAEGRTISFTVAGTPVGTATTDANGIASLSYRIDRAPGSYPINARFDGDVLYLPAQGSGTLTVDKYLSTLTVENAAGIYAQPATLRTTLTSSGSALPALPLTFRVAGTPVGTAVTDANGVATLPYTISLPAGSHPITVTFGGDSAYEAAAGSGTLTVSPIEGTLLYTGTTVGKPTPQESQTLSATFTPSLPGGNLALASIRFTVINTASGATVGTYTVPLTASGTAAQIVALLEGTYTVQVTLVGNGYYTAPDVTATMYVYKKLPGEMVSVHFDRPYFETVTTDFKINVAQAYVNIRYVVFHKGTSNVAHEFWAYPDGLGRLYGHGTWTLESPFNGTVTPGPGDYDFRGEVWFGNTPTPLTASPDTTVIPINVQLP